MVLLIELHKKSHLVLMQTMRHKKVSNVATYIKLVSLYYLRWWIVTIIMGLIVFIPLISLQNTEINKVYSKLLIKNVWSHRGPNALFLILLLASRKEAVYQYYKPSDNELWIFRLVSHLEKEAKHHFINFWTAKYIFICCIFIGICSKNL